MGIFKAYDVRGIVPKDLNAELARKIGRAAVKVLEADSVVVGRDMRISSDEIAKAFMEGVRESGADSIDTGQSTTPMNYFAVGRYGYGAAAMVTASHNPPEWNGFKFSRAEARPVSADTGLGEMERLVSSNELPPPARRAGRSVAKDIVGDYMDHLLSFAGEVAPMKVAIDTGNGMAGRFLPVLFERLPCELCGLYLEPDGTFPNHEPNPLKLENMRDLQRFVKEINADIGMAFDGDGDRVALVDERGGIVPCDLITALLAREFLREEPGAHIIYDLRSSLVVPEEVKKAGGVPVEYRVGHSFMKGVMRERDAPMGGELSGHYYFRDTYYSDSGDLAMLTILRVLSREKVPLSELIRPLRRYHATGEINFEVEDKDAKIKELSEAFRDAEVYFLDGVTVRYNDWWCNVRKSNTEPLLRLNLEAKTEKLRDEARRRVEEIIRR